MDKVPTFLEFSDRNGKNEITVSAMDYVNTSFIEGDSDRMIMLPDLNIKESELLEYLRSRYSLNISTSADG